MTNHTKALEDAKKLLELDYGAPAHRNLAACYIELTAELETERKAREEAQAQVRQLAGYGNDQGAPPWMK